MSLPSYQYRDGMTPGQYKMSVGIGAGSGLSDTPMPTSSYMGGMPRLRPPRGTGGTTGGTTGGSQGLPTPAGQVPTTPNSAYNAFSDFADSAGMKFAMEQAMNALNNQYAAHGQLQSGAAAKGISDYAQNMALQNYFFPYMNYLGGQQAVGAGAASSIAGVGSNFGNTAAGINGQMGGVIQNGANNASNAALYNGYNNAGMWNTIGSSLGSLGSSFLAPSAPASTASSPINVTPHYGSYY